MSESQPGRDVDHGPDHSADHAAPARPGPQPGHRPNLARMLLRGAFRRCPWCSGKGAFFSSYYRKDEHCLTCGLRWRRDDVGYELGAAAMAAIITLGPLMLLLLALVVATWPEIEVPLMFAVLGAGALVLPFFTYPRAYIMWQGVDIVMRPVEESDFDPVP